MNSPDTSFFYHDRQSKQKAVAKRFGRYLTGRVLDVGADEGLLEQYLSSKTNYTGVGLGGRNPKVLKMDLEKSSRLQTIPLTV